MLTYLTSSNHYFPSTITIMELTAEMENRRQLQKVWIVLSHLCGQAPFLELWYFFWVCPERCLVKDRVGIWSIFSSGLVSASWKYKIIQIGTFWVPDLFYTKCKREKNKMVYFKNLFFNWKISNQLKIQPNSIKFPRDYSKGGRKTEILNLMMQHHYTFV